MEDIGVFPRPAPVVQWIARPDVIRTAEGRFVVQEQCLLTFEQTENLPPFGAAQIGQRRKTGSRKQALLPLVVHAVAFRARKQSTIVPLLLQGTHRSLDTRSTAARLKQFDERFPRPDRQEFPRQ